MYYYFLVQPVYFLLDSIKSWPVQHKFISMYGNVLTHLHDGEIFWFYAGSTSDKYKIMFGPWNHSDSSVTGFRFQY